MDTQTAIEYTERQKRILFVEKVRSKIRGLEFLLDAECFHGSLQATALIAGFIVEERTRRDALRKAQLEIEWAQPRVAQPFDLNLEVHAQNVASFVSETHKTKQDA